MNEPELIQGLKQGNEAAFEKLVQTYKNRIYNTALGFLQNEYDAEEITQEVFIKVFENIKGFKNESKLSTWMYRITVTQSLDFLQKRKRKKRAGFLISIFSREKDEWEVADFHHPGIAVEQKENAAILFKAIRQLPDQQQSAFLLQKVEGLDQREIAEILKTTEAAVESLLYRAKTNLRNLLAEFYKNNYG